MMSSPMTTCPGARDFMPPEALYEHNSVYDYKLDCFSFGHLALYLWNQKQPIVSTTVNREDVDQKKQQFARRRPYFKCMENHPDISNLLSACLADECYDRPSSKEILSFFNKKVLYIPCRMLKHACIEKTEVLCSVTMFSGNNVVA